MRSLTERTARRIEIAITVVLTSALVFLHFVVLTNAGTLWRDEISSLSLATKPSWQSFWSTLVFDPFPVLFFLLLRLWSALGAHNDFELRLLGVMIGCAIVFALWVSARLLKRATPFIAFVLIGFNPVLIFWGDTLRPYGLGVVWIIFTFACFWRLLERPNLRWFMLAALLATAAVQTLFTNSLLVFACGVSAAGIAAIRKDWRAAAMIIAAGCIAACSLVIYLPIINATHEWSIIRKAPFPLLFHLQQARDALAGWGTFSFRLWLLIIALCICVTAIAYHKAQEHRALALYGLATSAIAALATFCFFSAISWPTHVWYYLPLLTVCALALFIALDVHLRAASLVLLVVVAGCTCLGLAAPTIIDRSRLRASNVDEVAQVVDAEEHPGDFIVIDDFTYAITFSRYYHGRNSWMSVPPLRDLSLHNWGEVMRQMQTPDAMRPLLDQVQKALTTGHRVWLITGSVRPFPASAPEAVPPFDPHTPRSLGFYLHSWSEQLRYELRRDAKTITTVQLKADQPISRYEEPRVVVFE